MFNSSRQIREQALSHRELVKGKRRFNLLSMEKLKNINFKKKLKDFTLSSIVGGLSTQAGYDIYDDTAKHHGNSTNPASTNGNGTSISTTPLITTESNSTNIVTTNGIPMYNNPTTSGNNLTNLVTTNQATNGNGIPVYNNPTTGGSNPTNLVTTNGISMYNNPTTPPTTSEISSTNPVSTNPIARANDEERAIGHSPSVNVFGEPSL
jgi:hypothetical protein